MTQVRTMKLAAMSAMVGALLLLGAFLITSSMVGAQTPPAEPTPSSQEPATPRQTPRATPEDESEDESAGGGRSRADCPKDESGSSTTPSGASGTGSPRSFRQ